MFIDLEDSKKEVLVKKKLNSEINEINLDKRLVGGGVIRSDIPDGQQWVTPYDVTEDTAHEYMKYCQVLGFMHGDLRYLKKFLHNQNGVDVYKNKEGREIVGIDFEKLEKSLVDVKKNTSLDFEIPGETEYGKIVGSMFFSERIIELVKNGIEDPTPNYDSNKIIAGDWYAVVEVGSDKVLQLIKDGKIKSLSVAGKALIKEEEGDNDGM